MSPRSESGSQRRSASSVFQRLLIDGVAVGVERGRGLALEIYAVRTQGLGPEIGSPGAAPIGNRTFMGCLQSGCGSHLAGSERLALLSGATVRKHVVSGKWVVWIPPIDLMNFRANP